MAFSTPVQGWTRTQSHYPILKVVLIETATSLAKEQYTTYNTGIPKWNSLLGIYRQRNKQGISFKANQSCLP